MINDDFFKTLIDKLCKIHLHHQNILHIIWINKLYFFQSVLITSTFKHFK